jgi:pimeloyl-ACP methyl ester carboxylesterase
MTKIHLSLLFIILSLSGNLAVAGVCGQGRAEGYDYGYCLEINARSPDVIYVLHGAGGSEKNALNNPFLDNPDSRKVWEKAGFEAPTVVSFSFGEHWLLSDLAINKHPALLTLVTDKIIPDLEHKIGGVRGKRILFGWSMGGFNGAVLSLRKPNYFDRVALLCPGIFTLSPYDSEETIQKFLDSLPKSVNQEAFRGNLAWAREEFPSATDWDRHSPYGLAQRATNLKASFFTSCSKDDGLGFFPGAKAFAAELAEKTESQWVEIESGGHCAQSKESLEALARFVAGVK